MKLSEVFYAREPMWKFWNPDSGMPGGLLAGALLYAVIVFGGLAFIT